MPATMASASFSQPRSMSQRGLSGTDLRNSTIVSPSSAPLANAKRQPSAGETRPESSSKRVPAAPSAAPIQNVALMTRSTRAGDRDLARQGVSRTSPEPIPLGSHAVSSDT